MPLSDYVFDQSHIRSAVNAFEILIQNINNDTLPNINNVIQNGNVSAIGINEFISHCNEEIVPILINTVQSIQNLTDSMQTSLILLNELIETLICAVHIFLILFTVITTTYFYSKCCKHTSTKMKQL